MNKNTLIVLVVILVPIIVLGIVAVSGAENFEKMKEKESETPPAEEGNETTGLGSLWDPIHSIGPSPFIDRGALEPLT